jgi:hypothetical protein
MIGDGRGWVEIEIEIEIERGSGGEVRGNQYLGEVGWRGGRCTWHRHGSRGRGFLCKHSESRGSDFRGNSASKIVPGSVSLPKDKSSILSDQSN